MYRAGIALALLFLAGCSGSRDSADDASEPPDDTSTIDARDAIEEVSGCASDIACDDDVACTIDRCEDGACHHDACTDCCQPGFECDAERGCLSRGETCEVDDDCVDAVACTLDVCTDGKCTHRAENALCEPGKVCESHVGCIAPPSQHCETAADCEGASYCVAEWSCVAEFGCVVQSAETCDDGNACTDDACVEELGGCFHAARDNDLDGYGDAACGGNDCDDADRDVSPGATERCYGPDDDCDTMIDEGCCVEGVACTTACGTEGTRACLADGTEGECVPPTETCNGLDDDCDGIADNGFECALGAGEACTTGCGSTGGRTCSATCAWNACVVPDETCNQLDDDCDGVADNGFECTVGAMEPCTTACGTTGIRTCRADCGWDVCAIPGEVCNGADDNCNGAADDSFACVQSTTSSCVTSCGSTGQTTCSATCTASSCMPPAEMCNGTDDDCDSTCDDGFACCRGTNAACTSLGMGFASGTASCASSCAWNTSACSRCGNAVIDAGESCDGTNLGAASCTTVPGGYSGGTLRCTGACRFDTSGCTSSTWDPTGTYSVAPTLRYRCARAFGSFYLVNYDFGSMRFTDNGTTLTIDQMNGLNCTALTGGSAIPSRSFDVSCNLPGTCVENYRITGTFTSDDTFTATIVTDFTANGGGTPCKDCVDQSVTITGTR